MLRKILTSAIVCLISAGAAFAQTGSLSGTVTDAKSGETLVGANVYIPEIQKGAPTDADGHYQISDIPTGSYTVRVTYIGFKKVTQTVDISAGSNTADFALQAGMALNEMVVTGALGEQQNINSVTFASQEVDAEQLNVTQSQDIKTSLAGKVAGVQIVGQAGSKLGASNNIRIRGQISLTNALSEPLYVVDGVPGVNPNIVDMNNVQDVNVLKGPNATALYGQRGENGVVILTTKKSGNSGVSVELNNSLTIDKVSYIPNFQNSYGQGYDGEGEWMTYHYDPSTSPSYFKPMDGVKYINNSYADESWGPKMDGDQYGAWYNWFPDSPYYGETTSFSPNPDNIRDFYDTGVTNKANFAVNYTQEDYSARISYSNLAQTGILPSSDLQKHYLSGKFNYDVTDAFHVGVDANYTNQNINGDVRTDGYGNQTTGTFNNWFGRQLSTQKMKELQDLTTPEGIMTNWNWWGPVNYASTAYDNGYKKPAFWFNAYKWMDDYYVNRKSEALLLNADLSYDLSDNWELQGSASRRSNNFHYRSEVPFKFEQSSDQTGALYNYYVNSFSDYQNTHSENDYNARLNYQNNFDDWSVDAFAGSQMRVQHYDRFSAEMDSTNYQTGGLNIPNVYSFSNTNSPVTPIESDWDKQVFSLFGRANIGYMDMIYVNGSYRRDWSSALPEGNNGYSYPSVGASFVFTELMDSDVLSYGKVRVGWAQVGSDVGAEDIISTYILSTQPYSNPVTGNTMPKLYTDGQRVDPNIRPAINSSFEVGTDLRFYNDRVGVSATFYSEIRKDDIIPFDVSSSTGYNTFLTNAGRVSRKGIELSLDGTPVQNQNFQWSTTLNLAHNFVKVEDLPEDLQNFTVSNTTGAFGFVNITHEKGKEWGQLRGAAIKRDSVSGKPIIGSNGLYAAEQNHNYGSVLPDLTGGWINNLTYKGIGLTAAIDFQKGGKFFSLTEQWGEEDGLLDETAGSNDLGNPKRDPLYYRDEDGNLTDTNGNPLGDNENPVLLPEDERGGVHVTGVDANGNEVDRYVNTQTYYKQWYSNAIAEPFVHDASYIKLRELSLSYSLPKHIIGSFLNSARISFVARNVWMIAVAGDNDNRWDPSELGETYGEDGQLPGTRSYGFNINLTF